MNLNTQKNIWKYLDVVLIVISLILSFFAYKIITTYYSQANNPLEKIVQEEKEKEEKKTECLDCKPRLIDGVFVPEGQDNLPLLAIIIENHTDARPQAGLSEANLVVEAEAEGGITRLLAFYADDEIPERIGPIRSARPYFLDWSKEFSALFVHVGGSPEALAKIVKDNILNLNEFYNEKYFWRDRVNVAPHNVFTSGENLNNYLSLKGLRSGDFIPWEFKDEAPFDERGDSQGIKINFQRDYYSVEWKHNKEENSYIRYLAGEAHLSENGDFIKAKNIAIAVMSQKVLDRELRLKIENIGEGRSVVCMDGKCNEGKWKKSSSSSRMRFYDNENKEIHFNRGTTWIEVVKPEIELVY